MAFPCIATSETAGRRKGHDSQRREGLKAGYNLRRLHLPRISPSILSRRYWLLDCGRRCECEETEENDDMERPV